MGRLRTKSEYEDRRKARILENQARLENLGLQKTISKPRSLASRPKLDKRKWTKIDYSSTPLRRSNRLKGKPCDYAPSVKVKNGFARRLSPDDSARSCSGKAWGSVYDPVHGSRQRKRCGEDDCKCCGDLDMHQPCIEMEEVKANSAYEDLRKARILENQARLESLGLQKTISELLSISSKPKSQKRKLIKFDYSSNLLRRSNRLKDKPCDYTPSVKVENEFTQHTPSMKVKNGFTQRPSPDALVRLCSSKSRGSVYDPVYGICCHFCRQKKLCGEEECKHCGDLDMDQPCIGKTDCSLCHSSNGIHCRACLKVRYGEEMEEVRANKEWICPHCTEEKGINPYWICNSSLCLMKRKMAPTGIAIYRAREMGFKSVAHLLMDELQRRAHR